MDWQSELERRSVSLTDLAAAAGLHPATAGRIVNGKRPGWPRTVRALRKALLGFEPIEEHDRGQDQSGPADDPPASETRLAPSRPPPAEQLAAMLQQRQVREQLEQLREPTL